jgi:hypothetical protein
VGRPRDGQTEGWMDGTEKEKRRSEISYLELINE